MSLIITLGVIFIAAIGAFGYMAYIKHKRKIGLEQVRRLEVERDTVRIVQEFKQEQAAKAWEDFDKEQFDKEQWEIRFNEEQKRLAHEE